MLLFSKIWQVGLATEPLETSDPETVEVCRELDRRIKTLFGRALAIREVDAGSCIVDPSFFNWPALSRALVDNIVPDFPLCNKSFNQSYSGNDL